MIHTRFIAIPLALLYSAAIASAQDAPEDEGLRDLVQSQRGVSSLRGGQGIYVKNQDNGIPEDVLYDHPQGLSATLVRSDGKEYATKARYHREIGKIELWYGGRSYFADGEVFPYVVIGDNVYAYNDFGDASRASLRYGKLVAGTSRTDFQVLRRYSITRKSNVPSTNAYSREEPPSYRVDSLDILIGDRPFAIEVERRARRFRSYLTACGAQAHDAASQATKFRTRAYYDRLVAELQDGCAVANPAPKGELPGEARGDQ